MRIQLKILIIFYFLLFSGYSFTQNPDIKRTYHWYFGNKAGLDFSSSTPVPVTNSAMTAEEGSAVISDTCGNLLFYTDGDTVWSSNHQVMPNGTGLMGCWSSTQNSLIVPQPNNDSIYYIFLTDCCENPAANGLRYSTVNMNLNEGLGDVVQKNILIYAPAMEKLAGTYHANGVDIWILSLNRYPVGPPPDTTYQYFAYLLTSTGVNPIPIVSPSLIHPHKIGDSYLRFSHQGNKVANSLGTPSGVWGDTLEILDFDNSSGILSNAFTLAPDSGNMAYGVVFSPDDTKLYCTHENLNNWWNIYFKIFQYDLSSNDSATIAASKYLVHYSDTSTNPLLPAYYAMQTGADGRIYVIREEFYNPIVDDTISVITNPNANGVACNYIENSIPTGGTPNNVGNAGLPNFIDSYFRGSWQPVCNTGINEVTKGKMQINIYPNPSNGEFTVSLAEMNEAEFPVHINIYNTLGENLFQINMYQKKQTIYLNEKGGLYILTAKSNHLIFNSRIAITN